MDRKALIIAISVFFWASTAISGSKIIVEYVIPDQIPGDGVEVLKIYRYGPAELARIEKVKIQFCWEYGKIEVSGFKDFDGNRTTYKLPDTTWVFIPRHPEKIAGMER